MSIRHWLLHPVYLTRGALLVGCLAMGLLIGGLLYIGIRESQHARDQRDRTARAVERIQNLEIVTPEEIRALLERLIDELNVSPELREKIRRALRQVEGGDESSGGPPPPS